MGKTLLAAAFAFACAAPAGAAQEGAQPGDPMRIVILVDNSQTPLEPLPQIRRGLQQFVNALPPNHELMLVTTGGAMNIRVQPTRDYVEIQEAVGEINFMRSSGNALIGSIQEVYDRYLRTVERRFPMIVIVSTDGADFSQRVTDKTVNEMLQGLTKSGVLVNAVLLTSTGTSLIRNITLEMIKRTGGAYESATIATALPATDESDGRPHRRSNTNRCHPTRCRAKSSNGSRHRDKKRAAGSSPAALIESTNLPICQFLKPLALHHQHHVLVRLRETAFAGLPADAAVLVRVNTVADAVGLRDQLGHERRRFGRRCRGANFLSGRNRRIRPLRHVCERRRHVFGVRLHSLGRAFRLGRQLGVLRRARRRPLHAVA